MHKKPANILLFLLIFLPMVHLENTDNDEDEESLMRPSLMSRIKKHNFCAEKNSEFWLDIEDELPANTFFLPCSSLDEHWIECESLSAQKIINETKFSPCQTFGANKDGKLQYANVTCRVLPCIECHGPREFKRTFPCKKYTGYYFLSALLYSIFLGLFALDRFYLGYSAIAVGKLMTLGGLGVWWIVDIFLLLNGQLRPADGSEWQPFWTTTE